MVKLLNSFDSFRELKYNFRRFSNDYILTIVHEQCPESFSLLFPSVDQHRKIEKLPTIESNFESLESEATDLPTAPNLQP